jgi:hypothetical protein
VLHGWGENQDERENADKKGEKGGENISSPVSQPASRSFNPIGVFLIQHTGQQQQKNILNPGVVSIYLLYTYRIERELEREDRLYIHVGHFGIYRQLGGLLAPAHHKRERGGEEYSARAPSPLMFYIAFAPPYRYKIRWLPSVPLCCSPCDALQHEKRRGVWGGVGKEGGREEEEEHRAEKKRRDTHKAVCVCVRVRAGPSSNQLQDFFFKYFFLPFSYIFIFFKSCRLFVGRRLYLKNP